MNPKKYDLGYAEVMILTAVGVFFILAFGHWLLGCRSSSCDSNSDCPVGAFCDFDQPVGPICIPINDVVEEDGGTAVPSRLPSLPCPICTSMEFPVGCIIGEAITCAATAEDCPGVACDGGGGSTDAGDPGSDSGSDAGSTDAGSDAAPSTDAAEPTTPSCGDPICDYDWCGTMYSQNCAPVWNGDGDCDCGCQFFDTDCGG